MKITKFALILSGVAGLGLTLVYSEQGTGAATTKEQLLLRQKIDELNNTSSSQSRAQLLADAERLHKQGKINDEQFENLKKSILGKTAGPPLTPEALAKAQKVLDQKIAELNAGPTVAVTPPNPEVRAKAEEALRKKLIETQTQPVPRPDTAAVSESALNQKIAELNARPKAVPPPANIDIHAKAEEALQQKLNETPPQAPARIEAKAVSKPVPIQKAAASPAPEKIDVAPATATAALTPEQEAKARELLRMKAADLRKSESIAPQPNPQSQAKALTVLRESGPEVKAGVTPETPEQTRILRLKIAELNGVISPQDAAQVAVRTADTTAGLPHAAPATGNSAIIFQTSNKTGLARLNELTELYKADRITPADYHHERAKIVATL